MLYYLQNGKALRNNRKVRCFLRSYAIIESTLVLGDTKEVFFQGDRKLSVRSAVVDNVSNRNKDINAFENTLIRELLQCFCNLGFKKTPNLKRTLTGNGK